MTIDDLKQYVKDRSDSKDISDDLKGDHDNAVEYAWMSIDHAAVGLWPDAARFACLALKKERTYDPQAKKWRDFPRLVIETMEKMLWPEE